jgi:hypothetical protein
VNKTGSGVGVGLGVGVGVAVGVGVELGVAAAITSSDALGWHSRLNSLPRLHC